ncbi:uncharacterized protein LOC135464083 [Liolophura sinensis]|uniref:uncharacterized protein LOC135464083 n=1 Tax=Liolophura sinensis TaxID=3198878 RepID=UPI003158D1EC
MASKASLLAYICIMSMLIYSNAGLGNDSTRSADDIDDMLEDSHDFEISDDEERDPPTRPKEREIQHCVNTNSVCHTLMQYRDGHTVDEGSNCECGGCSNKWNQHDRKSLTWHHYERNDWLVQYRFCAPIIPERECENNEVAAILETEVDVWNIRMRKARCRCPSGEYYTSGWMKTNGKWRYEYVCRLPICELDQMCTKIYVDLEEEVKTGFQFNCACPDEYLCDTEYDVTGLESWEEDETGDYVANKCKRHKRKKAESK